jgi:arginyl-tRNA synthetase
MVAEQIRETLAKLADTDADFAVERPKQAEHGDYASNVAMVVAKKQGINPKSLAEQLAEKLKDDDRWTAVEVAGPGFLNFKVAPPAWQEALADVLKAKEKYGAFPKTQKKVQLEFISANPTGPPHLGNARGGYAGDVLANVLARAGHQVEREYYINDAGGQVEELGSVIKGESDSYKGQYIDELKKRLDTKKSATEVGAEAADLMAAEARKTVKRMGIRFDGWFSEQQELREKDEINRVLADLKKIDATYEKDGAVWLKSTHFEDDKDRVLVKSDGAPTYLAADLAYHFNKFVKRNYGLVIDIVGADHHGDVARLKAGVEFLRKVEHFDGNVEVILVQFVRLVQGGKAAKMSKRAGTAITPDELLDEVEADVVRFFFVMKNLDTHMDFDLDLAKEQSPKNPVYYLKYAFARIAGILKKAGKSKNGDLSKLTDPAELNLIRELSEFPSVISRTAADYQVQRLPHYALGLADAFHKFYEQCPVISDDQELTAARLQLVQATRQVLQNAGDTLGIDLPDRM